MEGGLYLFATKCLKIITMGNGYSWRIFPREEKSDHICVCKRQYNWILYRRQKEIKAGRPSEAPWLSSK
jgi:hypothetical protein